MRHSLRIFIVIALILGTLSQSQATYDPEKLIIRDVSGRLLKIFSIDELKKSFPQQLYDTRTPWTKATQKILYRGPLIKDVLTRAGVVDNISIKMSAYDDFISKIHKDEIQKYAPILAVETGCTDDDYNHNICQKGQKFRPISMIEKGPIFIVWPYNDFPRDYFPARNAIWVFFPVMMQPDQ